MKRKDNFGCDEHVSPEVVDRALKAFWRGSAGPIDRLVGASEGDGPRLGELLLLVLGSASARPVASARRSREENL